MIIVYATVADLCLNQHCPCETAAGEKQISSGVEGRKGRGDERVITLCVSATESFSPLGGSSPVKSFPLPRRTCQPTRCTPPAVRQSQSVVDVQPSSPRFLTVFRPTNCMSNGAAVWNIAAFRSPHQKNNVIKSRIGTTITVFRNRYRPQHVQTTPELV